MEARTFHRSLSRASRELPAGLAGALRCLLSRLRRSGRETFTTSEERLFADVLAGAFRHDDAALARAAASLESILVRAG